MIQSIIGRMLNPRVKPLESEESGQTSSDEDFSDQERAKKVFKPACEIFDPNKAHKAYVILFNFLKMPMFKPTFQTNSSYTVICQNVMH